MKDNDSSRSPVIILDNLDVIVPCYDQKYYLRWPPWPWNECFIANIEGDIKWKIIPPVVHMSTFQIIYGGPLTSIWPKMWPQLTSSHLKKKSTDIEWLIKQKVITSVSSSSACLPKLVFNACRWTTEVITFHLINHSIYAEICWGHWRLT